MLVLQWTGEDSILSHWAVVLSPCLWMYKVPVAVTSIVMHQSVAKPI